MELFVFFLELMFNLVLCEVVRYIVVVVCEGKCICIYGDYDVDGVSVIVILVLGLCVIGVNVYGFIFY